MKGRLLSESVGWCGTFAILLAYVLISFNFVSSSSLVYQLLNCSGAIGIVYISFKKRAHQPGVLNLIWAIIAVIAILRLLA